MVKIKVKTLTREAVELCKELGLTAIPEYKTEDGSRIDIAVLNGEEKLVAIELEASFKWMRQRVLYNAVKAHRAGFRELWIVTPFKKPKLGWVEGYVKELGLRLEFVNDGEMLKRIDELKVQLARR
ncbi:hypothetical protein [Thermococcus sp. GR6]|uniref:hypothetical protein n=1 Tax=Thermococcus sp. GR6 TaxID=1638256 RepID=UPI0014308D95|nr:hypothetical protein [Thermococcus sp. GR6]